MVREKRFREDLYYRLMVVPIHVPALRSRRGDISPLAMSFLRHFMERHSKRVAISQEAFEFLRQYDWPGNVRELENTLERAVVLATDGQTLSSDDIPVLSRLFPQAQDLPIPSTPQVMQASSIGNSPMTSMGANNYHRVVLGREAIEKALASTHGQQTLAAQSLGVTLRQLRYRMQQLMIDAKGYRQ
jgi:Nif-specific regulatory protein